MTETALTTTDQLTVFSQKDSLFYDVAKFDHAQRIARIFAESTMVPEHFRGNIGNVLIAMNYADRIEADIFQVMQNMVVINGKPGLEAKLVVGLINNSGKFSPIQYREVGNLSAPDNLTDGCTAYATDLRSKTVLESPMVTWRMVKGEGWYAKKGSKWASGLGPLMFRYRAVTFFARLNCPEVLLGMQTKEELIDVSPMVQQADGSFEVFAAAADADPIETADESGLDIYMTNAKTVQEGPPEKKPEPDKKAEKPPVDPPPPDKKSPEPEQKKAAGNNKKDTPWWHTTTNWINKRGEHYLYLVRIGLSLPLDEHLTVERDGEMVFLNDKDIHEAELKKAPDAYGSLLRSHKVVIRKVIDKMVGMGYPDHLWDEWLIELDNLNAEEGLEQESEPPETEPTDAPEPSETEPPDQENTSLALPFTASSGVATQWAKYVIEAPDVVREVIDKMGGEVPNTNGKVLSALGVIQNTLHVRKNGKF